MKHELDEMTGTAVQDRAQSRNKPESGKPNLAEMQKKMAAAAAPGPAHRALDALVGDWKAELKCWSEPGGAPNVTRGTAKTQWTLKGHFLEEEFHGESMGQQFTGRYLMGYDNVKQTFSTVWISDIQTSMLVSEGRGDNGYKVITLEGKSSCAATGRRDMPIKSVFRINNPNQHVFEMYDASTNAKMMEITYTKT